MIPSALGCRQGRDGSVVPVLQSSIPHCSLATVGCIRPGSSLGSWVQNFVWKNQKLPPSWHKTSLWLARYVCLLGALQGRSPPCRINTCGNAKAGVASEALRCWGGSDGHVLGRWSPSLPGLGHSRGMVAAGYPAPPIIRAGFPSLSFTLMGLSLKGQCYIAEHPHPGLAYCVLMCFI